MIKNRNKIAISGIIIVTILFLSPILLNHNVVEIFSYIISNYNDLILVLQRSLLFALSSSVLCVLIGFFGGIILKPISVFSPHSRAITLLFIPYLLGNVSIAFVFKLILLNIDINLYETRWVIFYSLLFIQIWQYGTLFIYLFWMNFQNTHINTVNYFDFYKLNIYEKIKDIYLPHSKNLIILTSIIVFVFSFYEDAKSQIIFKTSQGTGTEMISQWLYRNYRSDIFFSYDQAINKVLGFSEFIIIPIQFIFALLLVGTIYYTCTTISKSRLYIPLKLSVRKENIRKNISLLFLSLVVISILIPIIFIFIQTKLKFENITDLLLAIIYTLTAAFFSCSVSILLSFLIRITYYKWTNNFNPKSLVLLSILFIFLIIPPISIMICGFKWMSILSYESINQFFIWFMGHILLCLPVLSGFLLVSAFRIPNNELEYYKIYNVKLSNIFMYSFLKRFKLEYILCYIFAFSMVWNEAILNRIFSDDIPSFITRIMISINSRKADFSTSLLYFMISCLLAFSVVALWNNILTRYNKKKHEQNNN